MSEPVQRCVDLPARSLRLRIDGRGAPVVLVPSLGRSSDDFASLATSLVDAGHRVVLVDPPGIGTPLPDAGPTDLHEAAADLWAALDHVGIERAALVGHAYGNRLVRTASADQPDRVTAIALLACGGDVEPPPGTWEQLARCFDSTLPAAAHLAAVHAAFFAPVNDPSPWAAGWRGDVAGQQAASVAATDAEDFLLGGTAPMLVLQGLDDQVAVPENAEHLARRRRDAEVISIDRCGHAMLPEQPAAIAEHLVRFLAAHLGRPG